MKEKLKSLWYELKWRYWRGSYLRTLYWKLQHRFNPRHQYNMIRLPLDAGYYDPDTRIIVAVFTLVSEFVTLTADQVVWDDNEHHEAAWKVFIEASAWWKENRKHLLFEDDWISFEHEEKVQEEAKQHLHKIVDKIGFLWYP